MADLNSGHGTQVVFVEIPGRPNQYASLWVLQLKSTADSITIPELEDLGAKTPTPDRSAVRVLDPPTGIALRAMVPFGESDVRSRTVLINGGTAGQMIILAAIHKAGRINWDLDTA